MFVRGPSRERRPWARERAGVRSGGKAGEATRRTRSPRPRASGDECTPARRRRASSSRTERRRLGRREDDEIFFRAGGPRLAIGRSSPPGWFQVVRTSPHHRDTRDLSRRLACVAHTLARPDDGGWTRARSFPSGDVSRVRSAALSRALLVFAGLRRGVFVFARGTRFAVRRVHGGRVHRAPGAEARRDGRNTARRRIPARAGRPGGSLGHVALGAPRAVAPRGRPAGRPRGGNARASVVQPVAMAPRPPRRARLPPGVERGGVASLRPDSRGAPRPRPLRPRPRRLPRPAPSRLPRPRVVGHHPRRRRRRRRRRASSPSAQPEHRPRAPGRRPRQRPLVPSTQSRPRGGDRRGVTLRRLPARRRPPTNRGDVRARERRVARRIRRRHRLGRGDGGDARGGTREDDGEGARADRRATPAEPVGDPATAAAARVAARSARDAALALGARLDEMAAAGGAIQREGGARGEVGEVVGGHGGRRNGRAPEAAARRARVASSASTTTPGAKSASLALASPPRRRALGDATNRVAVFSPGSPVVLSPRRAGGDRAGR